MTPNFYIDVKVRAMPELQTGDRKRQSIGDVLSKTVQLVHAFMTRQKLKMAVAFPDAVVGDQRAPGKTVRVFAEFEQDLENLANDFEICEFAETVHLLRIKTVPADFAGPFVEYRRFRIRRYEDGSNLAREEQIQRSRFLPAIMFTSKSNGQPFTMFFDVIARNSAVVECTAKYVSNAGEGPNGYGLSTPDRPFALPSL